jgi:hypothetical protein
MTRITEFIARNVVWWGLSRLAPKEIGDLEEPREVIAMFPVSVQSALSYKQSENLVQDRRSQPQLSSILFLYPGRTRKLEVDQSGVGTRGFEVGRSRGRIVGLR